MPGARVEGLQPYWQVSAPFPPIDMPSQALPFLSQTMEGGPNPPLQEARCLFRLPQGLSGRGPFFTPPPLPNGTSMPAVSISLMMLSVSMGGACWRGQQRKRLHFLFKMYGLPFQRQPTHIEFRNTIQSKTPILNQEKHSAIQTRLFNRKLH